MKTIDIGPEKLHGSVIIQGCMRIGKLSESALLRLIVSDIENGINYFDHADKYQQGDCETLFGKVIIRHPLIRDKILIQTKCGKIGDGNLKYYDFSKEHILDAVNNSLKRLHTDHIDYLLLHRPDALVEPEEVADAFDDLYNTGKVLHFGVSNHSPSQIELLKKYVKQPIEVNQLRFGIKASSMIDEGINVNTAFDGAKVRDSGILDYCRLKNITIQAWSPFQYGSLEGTFLHNTNFPILNTTIKELADKYNVNEYAVAAAWILRHPAKMQVVAGSTNPKHMNALAKGADITLTRKEWYKIYMSAGNKLP